MSYNEKSDIWSMGCMLYEMCALHPPFTASNQVDLNKKICIGDYKRIPSRYSEDLNTIISKLLCVEVFITSPLRPDQEVNTKQFFNIASIKKKYSAAQNFLSHH